MPLRRALTIHLASTGTVAAIFLLTVQAHADTWCIPGTAICGTVNGQANGNANGNGQVQPPPAPAPQPPPPAPPPPAPVPPPPPPAPPAPPPPAPPPPSSPPEPRMRGANAISTCGAVRVGFWSGFHGGACAGFTVRGELVGFDIGLMITGGGTVPTLDFTLPVQIIIPLGDRSDLFSGPYIGFGPDFGYAATLGTRSGGFFNIGGHVGGGYETRLSDSLALRVAELGFYAWARADKTPVDSDRVGHQFDLGFTLSSGVIFK